MSVLHLNVKCVPQAVANQDEREHSGQDSEAGKMVSHGAATIRDFASEMMFPHEGIGRLNAHA